jgi:succinyl-CoA synthetase alpha subunit
MIIISFSFICSYNFQGQCCDLVFFLNNFFFK